MRSMVLNSSLDELMEHQMLQYYQIGLNIYDRPYIYIYIYIYIYFLFICF